jgi:SAM-dependent methyltransferase
LKLFNFADIASFYDIDYDETYDHTFLNYLVNDDVGSILEIPCGVGRNVIHLAKTNKNIVAVDKEPFMVKELKKRINMIGGCENVFPEVGDMCSLSLGMKFDLIIVPREAFQLILVLDDVLKTLKTLKLHLSLNGILMIDLYSFNHDSEVNPGVVPDYYDPSLCDGRKIFEWKKKNRNGDKIIRYREQYHKTDEIYLSRFFYHIEKKSGKVVEGKMDMYFRLYTNKMFSKLIKQCGLYTCKGYCNYNCDPIVHDSSRSIYLLKKCL